MNQRLFSITTLDDSPDISAFLVTNRSRTVFFTLSLHDALPICRAWSASCARGRPRGSRRPGRPPRRRPATARASRDRKSTRLNSSHLVISYAVFCLKKKKQHARNKEYAELKQEGNELRARRSAK